jgi:hypothetical protein
MSQLRRRQARVLLFSMRNIDRHVSRCGDYEFEDIISCCDDAEVIAPFRRRPRNPIVRHVSRMFGKDERLIDSGKSERLIDSAVRANDKYDLFFALCRNGHDLRHVGRLERLIDTCRRSVCVVSEVWPSKMREVRERLQILRRFDHVFTNLQTCVGPIEEATGKPCRLLDCGVDALRFCPFPENPTRSIDVYSMGRRVAEEHQALLASAARGEMFYVYDTTADFDVMDPLEHRLLLANLIKRSRYFITYPAKFDVPLETGGKLEIGARYFEGAAGGAVMIGMAPQCTAYDNCFGWRDAVIPTSCDGKQIACVVAELDAQPLRVAQIRRNNVINSLLRHDWAYRWHQILDCVGLPAPSGLVEREAELNRMAGLLATASLTGSTYDDSAVARSLTDARSA